MKTETKTESQAMQILNYMLLGCRITPLEALTFFGSLNLRNRICEIRDEFGIEADRKLIAVNSANGKKYVCQYWINPKRATK